LENAHSADADTRATYEVLKAQLERYPDLENSVDYLSEFSTQEKFVDFAGRIIYDKNNVEIFNFGKYKGQAVADVFRRDPSYYSWIMEGDFSLYLKKVVTQIRVGIKTK
jgi:DNA polymerase-3 subunit epsilon